MRSGIDSQTETVWAPRRSWGWRFGRPSLAPARSGQALMQARPRPSPFPIPGRRTQPSAPSAGQSPAEDSGLAGADRHPRQSSCREIHRIARWADRDRVNVAALRDMTDDSGGRTEIIRSARDLDPATASIADELSRQYYMGYAAAGKKDGRWHAIRVEVRNGNYLVRARKGFVATP